MSEVNQSTIHTFLSFRVGDETFATNVSKVLEILEVKPVTKVPKAPEYMKGVINLRGNVLPVIDLRIKFGMPAIKKTKDTCIVVFNVKDGEEDVTLGAMVDAVMEVLEFSGEAIEPAPSIGSKYKSEFIEGMVKKDDNFIMVLNTDLVFTSDELSIFNTAVDAGVEEVNVDAEASVEVSK